MHLPVPQQYVIVNCNSQTPWHTYKKPDQLKVYSQILPNPEGEIEPIYFNAPPKSE